jgi:hypothetical protein
MSDALSSNKLVQSIKRRASIPENQATFTKQDFLDFANEELRLALVPDIISLHEDYLLFETLIPVERDKREYEIPSRAVGNKLKDVQYKVDDRNYVEMTRVNIGDRFTESSTSFISGLRRFYIKNNKIILLESPQNERGHISMIFFIKPSLLVEEDRIAVITGINRSNGQVVVNSIPSEFNLQKQYDFYKSESPHSIISIDQSAILLDNNSNTITFNPDNIPESIKVGDHIALAGECSIPQVPSELQIMLAQLVACRVLDSIGDRAGLQSAMVKLNQMKEAAGMLIDNRVVDAPKKVRNRHGTLRTAIFSKRFNRR